MGHYISRLKSILCTRNTADSVAHKETNNSFHPIAVKLNGGYDVQDEHSFQIQVGSKTMPEYTMSSVTETLYQLGKTVGLLHTYGRWYRSHRYTIVLDLENISGAGFTGMNTKAGDQLTLNFKDYDAVGYSSSVPTRMFFCVLHYDAVLNIGDAGIQLLG